MIAAMLYAAEQTAAAMQGFKLAYIQSDECTFMITDFDAQETQGWFGYRLNKLVSVTAAMYTGWFNHYLPSYLEPGFFDARAFVVPLHDAPNVFVWRQKDWERNSLQMLAQHHFSHKQLHGKNHADLHEMLHSIEVNWADLTDIEKNGTFLLPQGKRLSQVLSYEDILDIITPKVGDDEKN
jgi:tRNA(His) 5'-end guanylyltransferase